MSLVLGTRIALYLQLALGIAQSPGVANDVPGLLHMHRTLAFIVPVLAYLAFGTHPTLQTMVLTLARFAPPRVAALILGFVNRSWLETRSGVPQTTVRTLARFAPLVALILGLVNWVGFKMMAVIPVEAYWSVMVVHFVWGIAVVAFAEMAAGQANRALRGVGASPAVDHK